MLLIFLLPNKFLINLLGYIYFFKYNYEHACNILQVEEVEEKVENLLEPAVLQDQEAKEVEHESINGHK